jgi:hypothetical protein
VKVLVYTKNGLIPREKLEVKDIIEEVGNARTIATEWYLNGELVRRDAWANVYDAQSFSGEQPKIG